ncbi:MAG: patatin-like phospholipase family protein, partial [Muribaculaceae bacterium]|nr:patatin-like phospholipase family protein [Muribaculaceae bacterium]
LYSCGYTPEEMLALLGSRDFSYWSSGKIDPELTYYFLQKAATPAFANININLSRRDSTNRVPGLMPSSLISPLPMNFGFMELFSAYTAQCGGNFDNLFVPFRCVTSDIARKRKIVCRSGQLSDAIRASMTFPCVFAPIQIDSTYVYDGGLYDNFPVDVMRSDFAPEIMIGFDVHSTEPESDPTNILNTIENMAIVAQDYSIPPDEGVYVHIDVSKFSLLDWGKARELYEIGYNRTMEMIDSIKERVTSRISGQTRQLRRDVFKSKSPYVRFDSVEVRGGTRAQDAYLSHLFKPNNTDTFGIDHARLANYRALSPGRLSNLMPQARFNRQTGLFTLDLDATFKSQFGVGAGG